MPENSEIDEKTEGQEDGANRTSSKPLIQRGGRNNLSNHLLKPPQSLIEAMAWTHITLKNTDAVRKGYQIMHMKQWAEEFDCQPALDEIRDLLTFFPSLGGLNRSLALQAESKIVAPTALGIDLDRNASEEFKKAQKKRDEEETKERER